MSEAYRPTDEQAVAIARIAQAKADACPSCGCEQAKLLQFCPCITLAFISACVNPTWLEIPACSRRAITNTHTTQAIEEVMSK